MAMSTDLCLAHQRWWQLLTPIPSACLQLYIGKVVPCKLRKACQGRLFRVWWCPRTVWQHNNRGTPKYLTLTAGLALQGGIAEGTQHSDVGKGRLLPKVCCTVPCPSGGWRMICVICWLLQVCWYVGGDDYGLVGTRSIQGTADLLFAPPQWQQVLSVVGTCPIPGHQYLAVFLVTFLLATFFLD